MLATQKRWIALCDKIGARNNPELGRTIVSTYRQLLMGYMESRYYHNLNHISDGLVELDQIRHLADNADALEMAWWWHDFVYDSKSRFNEEMSAGRSFRILQELGVSLDLRIKIMELIFATKHDYIPVKQDERLIVDIDLVGLATPAEIFDHNTADIRKEYFWVSDEDFKKGRASFFQKLLKGRPSIYLTDYFRNKYEAQAQENLQRAIGILNG